MNMPMISFNVYEWRIETKCLYLVSQSIITDIVSYPFTFSTLLIKSMDRSSQISAGMGRGCKRLAKTVTSYLAR